MQINIKINGNIYQIDVYDNKTAKEVIEYLPDHLVMEDLHNNEKYASLNKGFPTDLEKVKKIHKGDVMLYGSDTLVIFYKDFETTCSYTPIGRMIELGNLEEVVGSGKIEVQFEIKKDH